MSVGNAGRCSGRYVHVPTDRVVARMREAGWLPVDVEEQRCVSADRVGFQKHAVSFRRAEQMQTLDEYNVELKLINSHDGGCAYQLHAGIYRRICSNGLVVADSGFEAIRYRHVGLTVEEVIRGSLDLADAIPALSDRIDEMRHHSMTEEAQVGFARRAIASRWETAPPIEVEDILSPRRSEDAGSDLWRVMNRVQENVLKGGVDYTAANGRTRRTRGLRGIDSRVTVNKAIWSIAEATLRGVYDN